MKFFNVVSRLSAGFRLSKIGFALPRNVNFKNDL